MQSKVQTIRATLAVVLYAVAFTVQAFGDHKGGGAPH